MGMTPSSSPSSPGNYASVNASGFDIQAPMEEAGIAAAFNAANDAAGAGVLYPKSERQAATERLMMSPPGFADFDILGGSHPGWPADVTPPDSVDNGGYGGA